MSDSLPVFIKALSGNTSDKNHFREIVQVYGQSLQEMWGEEKIWIWDSAGYSKKNLKAISEDYTWIMRVPETLSEAKEVLENADTEKMISTTLEGYRIKAEFKEDKSAIIKETLKKGKFIVATNELDNEKLGDGEGLEFETHSPKSPFFAWS